MSKMVTIEHAINVPLAAKFMLIPNCTIRNTL